MFKKILYCTAVLSIANLGSIEINATSPKINELFNTSENTITFNDEQILVNNMDKTSSIVLSKNLCNYGGEQYPGMITIIYINALPIEQNNIIMRANIKGDNNILLQYEEKNNASIPSAIKFEGNNLQFNGRFYLHPSIDTITFANKDSIIKNLNIPVSNSTNRNITINIPNNSFYEYITVPNNILVQFNKNDSTNSNLVSTWANISEQVYYDLLNNNYSITSDEYEPISRALQIAFLQSKMTIQDFIKAFYNATGTEITYAEEIKSVIDEMMLNAVPIAEEKIKEAIAAKEKSEKAKEEAEAKLLLANAAKEKAEKAQEEVEKQLLLANAAKEEAERAKEEVEKQLLLADAAKEESEKAKALAEEQAQKANVSREEAEKAKTEAENKLLLANAAREKAEKAKEEAEAKLLLANAAKEEAEAKLLLANAAKEKAERAKEEVEKQLLLANAAKEKAEKAKEEAEAKLLLANAAKEEAEKAKMEIEKQLLLANTTGEENEQTKAVIDKVLSIFNKYLPDGEKINSIDEISDTMSKIQKLITSMNNVIKSVNNALPDGIKKIDSLEQIPGIIAQVQEFSMNETVKLFNTRVINLFNNALPNDVNKIKSIDEIPNAISKVQELNSKTVTSNIIDLFNNALPNDINKIKSIDEISDAMYKIQKLYNDNMNNIIKSINGALPDGIKKIDSLEQIPDIIAQVQEFSMNETVKLFNTRVINLFNNALPNDVNKIKSIDEIPNAISKVQELNSKTVTSNIIDLFNNALPNDINKIKSIDEISDAMYKIQKLYNDNMNNIIKSINGALPGEVEKINDLNQISNAITSVITNAKKEQDIVTRNNIIKLINNWFKTLGISNNITGKDAEEIVKNAIEASQEKNNSEVQWKEISVKCNSIARWDWKERAIVLDSKLTCNDIKNYYQTLNVKYNLNKNEFTKQDILDELANKYLTVIYGNNNLYKIKDISEMNIKYYVYPSNKCVLYKNEHRLPLYCLKCYLDTKSKGYKGYILLNDTHSAIHKDNSSTLLFFKKGSECIHSPEYNEQYILSQLQNIKCIETEKFDKKLYCNLESE